MGQVCESCCHGQFSTRRRQLKTSLKAAVGRAIAGLLAARASRFWRVVSMSQSGDLRTAGCRVHGRQAQLPSTT